MNETRSNTNGFYNCYMCLTPKYIHSRFKNLSFEYQFKLKHKNIFILRVEYILPVTNKLSNIILKLISLSCVPTVKANLKSKLFEIHIDNLSIFILTLC